MLPSNNIQSIVGATLYGRDHEKLGRIDQVLVDAGDGHPTWALLHGGLFGRKSFYVPLDDATWERDDVYVPFDKAAVDGSPKLDTDGGLSPDDELTLHRHYSGRPEPTAGSGTRDADGDGIADADRSHDTAGGDSSLDDTADHESRRDDTARDDTAGDQAAAEHPVPPVTAWPTPDPAHVPPAPASSGEVSAEGPSHAGAPADDVPAADEPPATPPPATPQAAPGRIVI
jgi:hypothetical protein